MDEHMKAYDWHIVKAYVAEAERREDHTLARSIVSPLVVDQMSHRFMRRKLLRYYPGYLT